MSKKLMHTIGEAVFSALYMAFTVYLIIEAIQ